MANLLDYMHWRGDLRFDRADFTVLDALVLARMVYFPLEALEEGWAAGQPLSLGEACRALLRLEDLSARLLWEQDGALIEALAASERFGDCALRNFVHRLEADRQTQFAAVCVALDEGRRYLAFRGTDSTLVGWKENFNMTFVCPVPAQEAALAYLEAQAREEAGVRFILGGHSKGGNLATYAAAFCKPEIQERVAAVYNFDGPGFLAEVLEREGFRKLAERLHRYVPQESVVGLLLDQIGDFTVVHSGQENILLQHDVYSWEVRRGGFVEEAGLTNRSRWIDRTITEWLLSSDTEQREHFIDSVYQFFEQLQHETPREGEALFAKWRGLFKAAKSLDAEEHRVVRETLGKLIRSAGKEALESLKPQGGSEPEQGSAAGVGPRAESAEAEGAAEPAAPGPEGAPAAKDEDTTGAGAEPKRV